MKKGFMVILGLLLLLACGFFVWKALKSPQKPHSAARMSTMLPKEVTVTLDTTGFSPKEVTIKSGTAVRWKNATSKQQTVNSDDYPTNQLHKELNFGVFANGSSVVYIFKTLGTYGYHNQFHPEQKGEIIVTK